FTGERLVRSACASVLAARKSIPGRPAAIMVLTALPPPPPTPITLIRAPSMASTTSPIIHHLSRRPPPRRPLGLEELPQPAHHPVPGPPQRAHPRPLFPRGRAGVPREPVQHGSASGSI